METRRILLTHCSSKPGPIQVLSWKLLTATTKFESSTSRVLGSQFSYMLYGNILFQ